MADSIMELEKEMLSCKQCALHDSGNHGSTSFNGTVETPLMIVGEGPGGVEDEYGVPLVGPSGKLLDKALGSVGITRDRVYTTNVIKCRPRGNRTPTIEEGAFCAKLWLDEEIRLIKPQVIIALGSVALHYLADPGKKITKERGNWFQNATGIWTIATFHPAYLLRLTGKSLVEAKWHVYYDLKAAVDKCREIPKYQDYSFSSEVPPDLLALYADRREQRHQARSSN